MFSPKRYHLLVLPSISIFAIFFVLPMAYLLVISFWRLKFYSLVPDFTFANYLDAYREYASAGVFTFAISLLIATITTTLAFAFAYMVRFKAGRAGSALLFVTLATLFGGYLVKIYAWKTILGTQGILNTSLLAIGLIEQPLDWLLYNPGAVVVTLVYFLVPFALLPIYGSLLSLSTAPIEAARDLGAGPRRILIDVVLPQCQHGLTAGFALSFLIAAGDYVTPRLVGGPDTYMVGNFIESQFVSRLNAPLASALSYSVIVTCLLALLLFRYLLAQFLRPR